MEVTIYYAKINLRTHILEVYKGEKDLDRILEQVANSIRDGISYKQVDNYQNNDSNDIIYTFNNIIRLDESLNKGILGNITKESYIFAKQRDEFGKRKKIRMKNEEEINFYFDIMNEVLAFHTTKRFGHRQFINAMKVLINKSINTYIEEEKTLLTCDSFGSHYCIDEVFNDCIKDKEAYNEALKYYFDCILGPFKPFMLKAIDKIESLDIEIICPGHGPVLRENPMDIVNTCKGWCTPAKENEIKKIVIPYVTAYGYTGSMAQEILKGIQSVGNFDVKLYNIIEHDMADIVADINTADALIVGSPTILGDMLEPVRELLCKLNPVIHGGKVAAAFGSYGWSGEGVPRLETRLKELKMKMPVPSANINFKPSKDELDICFNLGAKIAKSIL